MAQISTRLFNYIPDQYLLLAGEEYLRPLSQLGNWQRLRLGILVSIREYNQATLPQAGLFLGLVSGRINTMSTLYCDNAIGVSLAGSPVPLSTRNWTYNAGANYPYFSAAAAGNFYRRYANPIGGNTFSQAGQSYPIVALTTSTYALPVSGLGIRKRRVPLVLDLSKNPITGVLTYTLYWPPDLTSGSSVIGDYRADHLVDACEQLSTPIVGGQTWTSSGSATLPYADSTGALDTFSVFWENQIYPLEVYAACANLIQDLGTVNADAAGVPAYPADGGSYDFLIPYSGSLVNTLTVGTGSISTATQLNTGRGWLGPYAFFGTGNLSAQYGTSATLQIALAGTSLGSDEPFEQYLIGTAYPGTLIGGTNWGTNWTVAGTYPNAYSIATGTLYGTIFGSDEPFEQYVAGTAYTGTLSAGTNWNASWAGTVVYNNPYVYLAMASLYGTIFGADEPFEQYVAGSVTAGTLSAGTNWGGPWVITGTS